MFYDNQAQIENNTQHLFLPTPIISGYCFGNGIEKPKKNNGPQFYPSYKNPTNSKNAFNGNNINLEDDIYNDENQYDQLDVTLPMYEYQKTRTTFIPFDGRLCNNGRFVSLDNALHFIAQHCIHNHGIFNRNLAKSYLKIAQIYNPIIGNYAVGSSVSKHDFDLAFRRISV